MKFKKMFVATLTALFLIIPLANSTNVYAKSHHRWNHSTSQLKHSKFGVNAKVYVNSNNHKYMYHAHARVIRVVNSKLYAVNYRPKGKKHWIKNYRWLINNQISGHLKKHAHVRLKSHYNHMRGASAVIVDVHSGPAYTVNYRPTNGGYVRKNYCWLTQSELKRR